MKYTMRDISNNKVGNRILLLVNRKSINEECFIKIISKYLKDKSFTYVNVSRINFIYYINKKFGEADKLFTLLRNDYFDSIFVDNVKSQKGKKTIEVNKIKILISRLEKLKDSLEQ